MASFSFNPFTNTLDYVGTATSSAANQKVDQAPVESPNGVRTLFTTATYVATSLRVMLNGQTLTRVGDFSETSSTTFTFVVAPVSTDVIRLDYLTP